MILTALYGGRAAWTIVISVTICPLRTYRQGAKAGCSLSSGFDGWRPSAQADATGFRLANLIACVKTNGMAHEIAKLMLEHAGTFLERAEAVRTALSLGMPLHDIEEYLDWLDSVRGPPPDSPGEEPNGR